MLNWKPILLIYSQHGVSFILSFLMFSVWIFLVDIFETGSWLSTDIGVDAKIPVLWYPVWRTLENPILGCSFEQYSTELKGYSHLVSYKIIKVLGDIAMVYHHLWIIWEVHTIFYQCAILFYFSIYMYAQFNNSSVIFQY